MRYLLIFLFAALSLQAWDFREPDYVEYTEYLRQKDILDSTDVFKVNIYKTDNDGWNNKIYQELQYNEKGACVLKKFFNKRGGVIRRIEHEIGTHNMIIRGKEYDINSKLSRRIRIDYDDQKRPIKHSIETEIEDKVIQFEYLDDRKMLVIKNLIDEVEQDNEYLLTFKGDFFRSNYEKVRITNPPMFVGGFDYKYDSDGNLIEKKYYNNDTGENYKIIYVNNEQGLPESETKFNSRGNLIFKVKKEYDAVGRIVNFIKFDANGEFIEKLNYRYF